MSRLRHRSRRKNKQRKIIIISICSILLFMSAGYAAMSTNLEIDAKGNVIKKANAGSELVDQAGTVTSGDGLYKDSYEENVYTYRGANPNNYVTFNGEQWRIISANTSDNTIKIMRNVVLSDRAFDTSNGRYQGNSGYCNNNYYGCNIWGSSSTLFDSSGINKITELAREIGNTKYALPTSEAELNIYLNTTYYNGLNQATRSMIKEDAMYKAGVLDYDNTSMSQDMEQVNATKWKGKVGLIDATEYVRASTYSSCTDVDSGYDTTNCKNNNWMLNSDIWWALSPDSYSTSDNVWVVDSSGGINGAIFITSASASRGIRPVITIIPEVKISGSGTVNDPYNFSLN